METPTSYTWEELRKQDVIRLYAGYLYPQNPQFATHIGLDPFTCSPRCIVHDVRWQMPLDDAVVDVYQAEDVFEHVEYSILPAVFNEIFRTLKVGGLFRLSLPDYRCDVLRDRCLYDRSGNIVFDPGGGGALQGTEVINGGHVWFPVFESVVALYEHSLFNGHSTVSLLHGYVSDEAFVLNPIDYSLGYISRTPDHDARVQQPPRPLSLVMDFVKTEHAG